MTETDGLTPPARTWAVASIALAIGMTVLTALSPTSPCR